MPRTLNPLTLRVRADLYSQLGAMETAGLPPEKAFGLLKLPRDVQPRVEAARRLLARGLDPAQAGEKSSLFGKLESTLVRAALAAGSPAPTYRRLGELYTKRAMQLASMKSRMWLPGFMLLVALVLGPIAGLITGSIGPGEYLWKMLRPMLIIGAIVYVARSLPNWTRDGAGWLDALLPRLPLFGRMHMRRNARDYFESLALLLEAGVPMLEALPKAEATIQNRLLRIQFERVHAMVDAGAPLVQALPPMPVLGDERALAFIQTGEAAGSLPEMLFRHADMETEAIDHFWAQVAVWVPRVVYALVAVWMAAGMIGGGGMMSQLPPEIR
jgi:general secretion pathway protein F